MTISVEQARKLIFAHLGDQTDQAVSESLLVSGDRYCGHRFRSDRFTVDWRLGEATATVSRDGRILETISLQPATDSGSRAA